MSDIRKKIAVITGTRAEYGLLKRLIRLLNEDPSIQMELIATGAHLSPIHGKTASEIEEDGFTIDRKIDILSATDSSVDVGIAMSRAMEGFTNVLNELKPNLIIVMGDRYEILMAAAAATVLNIPIAHISGGDITEGAFDDSFRHAITKMAHLHFVTHPQAESHVRQLGEDPSHIFNVGSPGLDDINYEDLLSKGELESSLDFKFLTKNILITFHPVTRGGEKGASKNQLKELLAALDMLEKSVGLIFTNPNADPEGLEMGQLIEMFIRVHPHAVGNISLGRLRYLSTMKYVDMVVGNSSSGICEAPSFHIPTINIGERQKGRHQAKSVVNANPKRKDIFEAITKAFSLDCSQVINPYGDGKSSMRIHKIITDSLKIGVSLQKPFFELRAT